MLVCQREAELEGRVAAGPVRRVERTSKPNAQLHGLYSVQFTAAAAEKPLTRDPLAQRYVLLLFVLGERALPLLAPRLDDDLLDLEGDRARHCLL